MIDGALGVLLAEANGWMAVESVDALFLKPGPVDGGGKSMSIACIDSSCT